MSNKELAIFYSFGIGAIVVLSFAVLGFASLFQSCQR